MSEHGSSARSTLEVLDGDGDSLTLTSRCSRPRCRKEFSLRIAPGRRQQYCSPMCRSLSEKEYKRAVAAAAHYERLLVDAASDVRAFGRSDDGEGNPREEHDEELLRRRAAMAWAAAESALRFVQGDDDPTVALLRNVVESHRHLHA